MSLINPKTDYTNWQSSGSFIFSSLNNYGTLTVEIVSSGSIESSSATGFYETNSVGNPGTKLNSSVSYNYSDNSIVCSYTGYIPSRFNIVFYFYSSANQGTLRTDYYYFTFTPIDKGSQDIISNDNANADKIIGSLGGNDDYNAPGSGDLGNLEDTEDSLINGNKAQSDEANNRINDNVLGSIQRLASSFGATAAMFQDMGLKLPDLSVLLYFSLILGIVPIIVGLSINNLRGHDAKVARERRREQYKSKGG
jgi:hypothetical protein